MAMLREIFSYHNWRKRVLTGFQGMEAKTLLNIPQHPRRDHYLPNRLTQSQIPVTPELRTLLYLMNRQSDM